MERNDNQFKELEEAAKRIFGPDVELGLVDYTNGASAFNRENELNDLLNAFENYLKNAFSSIDYIDLYEYLKKNIYGQDEQLLKVCACLKAYFTNISQKERTDMPFHFILSGPTGCGKTEVFRNIQKYFNERIPELPILLKDATSLTSEGYVGEGKNYLIEELVETNGYGIVFIDEFDKRILNSDYSGGVNFASETQNGLLQMIDGAVMSIKDEMSCASVDTNNTLFICMGAFEKEQVEEKHPGFNNENCMSERKDLTYDLLIKWGCERQLAARFCQIINFNQITDEVLEKIINKYIKQYKKSLNCNIIASTSYKKGLKSLYDRRYGTRNIRSMIWRDLQVPYLNMKNKQQQYISLNKISENGVLKTKKKKVNE